MTTTTNLSVATEAIDFQGDSFFKELVADLGSLPLADRASAKNADWEKLEKRLQKTVENRTGLQIEFDLDPEGDASILMPIVDWSHILRSNLLTNVENPDEILKFVSKAKKELAACIDLKNSRISGSLAKELKANMKISQNMLYKSMFGTKFTDEEVCAIMLHEIGHFFTMFEFLDRSVTTNQVMAELQRDLLNEKEPSKRELAIKTAGNDLHIDRSIVQSLQSSDDKTVTTVFLTTGMKSMRSQSGHSFYDMNTWEMLADQFATRHGAGVHMFTGMHKLITWAPDITMQSRAAFYYSQVSSVVSGILLIVGGLYFASAALVSGVAALAGGGAYIGIIAALLGINVVAYEHRSHSEPTYDNDLGRLTRLRNHHVQAIKKALGKNKSDFNTAYIKQLTSEVEMMDKVLKLGSNETSMVNKIVTYFNANEANRQANTNFQKYLEGLAHNDLYAKAAALKTI